MVQRAAVIFIDSNVFVIDIRYPHDRNAAINSLFLGAVKNTGAAISIYSLLEVLGVLSFNLSESQLTGLHRLFESRYGVEVVPGSQRTTQAPSWRVGALLDRISRRLSLGEALVLEHAETCGRAVEGVVSWDAPHFVGKTRLQLWTPAEFLKAG